MDLLKELRVCVVTNAAVPFAIHMFPEFTEEHLSRVAAFGFDIWSTSVNLCVMLDLSEEVTLADWAEQ